PHLLVPQYCQSGTAHSMIDRAFYYTMARVGGGHFCNHYCQCGEVVRTNVLQTWVVSATLCVVTLPLRNAMVGLLRRPAIVHALDDVAAVAGAGALLLALRGLTPPAA